MIGETINSFPIIELAAAATNHRYNVKTRLLIVAQSILSIAVTPLAFIKYLFDSAYSSRREANASKVRFLAHLTVVPAGLICAISRRPTALFTIGVRRPQPVAPQQDVQLPQTMEEFITYISFLEHARGGRAFSNEERAATLREVNQARAARGLAPL